MLWSGDDSGGRDYNSRYEGGELVLKSRNLADEGGDVSG